MPSTLSSKPTNNETLRVYLCYYYYTQYNYKYQPTKLLMPLLNLINPLVQHQYQYFFNRSIFTTIYLSIYL